jgi:hypothetical protein
MGRRDKRGTLNEIVSVRAGKSQRERESGCVCVFFKTHMIYINPQFQFNFMSFVECPNCICLSRSEEGRDGRETV